MAYTQIYCLRFVQYVIVIKKNPKNSNQKQKHDDCCTVYCVTVMDDENMC